MIELKVQKLREDAILPTRGSNESAGLDVYAVETIAVPANCGRVVVKTGIAIQPEDKNAYIRIAPRSGLAVKHGIDVLAGVVDYDYTGEVLVCLVNFSNKEYKVNAGDRIAQLICERIFPISEIREVDNLSQTERGDKGFGSTGK